MKADIGNALKRIDLNPLDTGATVTAAMIETKQRSNQIMTASRGMAFGLQAAPGIFSYFSEIITASLRDIGITAQTFVDDIVIIEKPDPEDFFEVTDDQDSIINFREPAFGKEVGNQRRAREALTTVRNLEERYRTWLMEPNNEDLINNIEREVKQLTSSGALWFTCLLAESIIGVGAINQKKMMEEGIPEVKKLVSTILTHL